MVRYSSVLLCGLCELSGFYFNQPQRRRGREGDGEGRVSMILCELSGFYLINRRGAEDAKNSWRACWFGIPRCFFALFACLAVSFKLTAEIAEDAKVLGRKVSVRYSLVLLCALSVFLFNRLHKPPPSVALFGTTDIRVHDDTLNIYCRNGIYCTLFP